LYAQGAGNVRVVTKHLPTKEKEIKPLKTTSQAEVIKIGAFVF
jgi:hypothetical protein